MVSFHLIVFLNFLFVLLTFSVELKDITTEVFSNGQYSGVIAAFGDFNSDKLTDVFCIHHGGKELEILFSNDTQPYLGQNSLKCSFKSIVTGVIPGDYNGDSMMDVLVMLEDESSGKYAVVLWGMHDYVECNNEIAFNVSSQPFIVDYNDDMIPDVIGEDENKRRCVWLSNSTKNFTKIFFPGADLQPFNVPHSSAVLDLNGDFIADLVITGKTNIEVWIKTAAGFIFSRSIKYPKANLCGQSTFVDFNTNNIIDHIMPVCYDQKCKDSAVLMWNNESSTWVPLLRNFTYQNTLWGFLAKEGRTVLEKAALPITLRSGDFNMDGFPDFIVTMENTEDHKQTKAVILENVPCSDCPLSRELKVHWDVLGLHNMQNVQLVTFFDMFENGALDVFALCKTNNNEWKVYILKNMDTYDAYFIKVLVLSGISYPPGHIPYGTNQPGPMITYSTTKPNGEPSASCAVQMSQSAHFSLQLPYSVFGLGQTPNFVDRLTVAIPELVEARIHKREWTQIIPNSQMVVIPFPPQQEHRWVNKLFLTPSHLVFLTCVSLIGTCGVIALIIGIFHWKERREDIKEKKQDAYRFHFDAM